MAKFIKLTDSQGDCFLLNIRWVVAIEEVNGGTSIIYTDGSTSRAHHVQEPVSAVWDMLRPDA